MSGFSGIKKKIETASMSRRSFLHWSSFVGGSAFAGRKLAGRLRRAATGAGSGLRGRWAGVQDDAPLRVVRTGCPSHNCGGRCLLKVTVSEGRIARIEGDDRPGDSIEDPQLRPCIRGRSYLGRQYHPDRLTRPMKRTGKRGEGRFAPISWEEAAGILAAGLTRIKAEYGNAAIYIPYGTGSYNQLNGRQTAQRLLNLFGGSLGFYNSYSWAAISNATPTVYGTSVTGNQRQDWLNARYILMWSWNPAEMRDGTNSEYFVRKAREKGARVVCIDPRMTLSAVALADEWIPIRPGTDAAMMSAMAQVMIGENLHDAAFVRGHCVGFDETQMPAGCEGAESYKDYILGTRDGTPKTPEWAERITGVPAATIARIAREYATIKPGVLYQGYGMQRRAFGEQAVRAGCVLAAITGNVGVPGGWASGMALQAPDGGPFWLVFPTGRNPVKAAIPSFLWTEAVLRGKDMGRADGVVGAEKLGTNIKLIWAVASNALINQHGNINRTARILADESLVELLVVQDNFLTPTGRFADLLLPACTQFETWGLEDGWKYGDEVLLMPKIVEPPGEALSDYAICAKVAERLGLREAYTEGRSERDWVAWAIEEYRKTRFPNIPALDEFEASNAGVYSVPVKAPAVAFVDFRRDPVRHPLATPSGRIEIFSKRLHDLGRPAEIPAVPKYVQEWESRSGRRRSASLCRSSGTITWPGSTRPWTTSIGSERPSPSASSSIRPTPRRAASRTGTRSGSSTSGGRPSSTAGLPKGSCRASSPFPRAPGGGRIRTVSTGEARSTS